VNYLADSVTVSCNTYVASGPNVLLGTRLDLSLTKAMESYFLRGQISIVGADFLPGLEHSKDYCRVNM